MTLINQNDPQYDGLFAHLQGNILKGHGREYTANIFITCEEGKQAATKEWIKSLVARRDYFNEKTACRYRPV